MTADADAAAAAHITHRAGSHEPRSSSSTRPRYGLSAAKTAVVFFAAVPAPTRMSHRNTSARAAPREASTANEIRGASAMLSQRQSAAATTCHASLLGNCVYVPRMDWNGIVLSAIGGRLSWARAGDILQLSPRQLQHKRRRWQRYGLDIVTFEKNTNTPVRRRVPLRAVEWILSETMSRASRARIGRRLEDATGVALPAETLSALLRAIPTAAATCRRPGAGEVRDSRGSRAHKEIDRCAF